MSTDDDIARLKAEEQRAKGRLGYVEKEYRETRDVPPSGASSTELDAHAKELGQLASQRNTLETTIAVKEADRQALERGRDALLKQKGSPERGPSDNSPATDPPPQTTQEPSPQANSQTLRASQAPDDLNQPPDTPPEQNRSGPDVGDAGAPAPPTPEQQAGASAEQPRETSDEQQKTLESRLPPFEPPPPGGFGPWDSREKPPERVFKPVDDVERIKNEQNLSRQHIVETNEAVKGLAYQREQSAKEIQTLGLNAQQVQEFHANEFAHQRDKMTALFQAQDRQLGEYHAQNTVVDPTMAPEQNEKREASKREVANHRFDVTYHMCADRAAEIPADRNAVKLQLYGERLDRDEVTGKQRQERVDNYSQDLAQTLPNPQQTQTAALQMQQQAFPQVAAEGPQFTQQQRTNPGGPPL